MRKTLTYISTSVILFGMFGFFFNMFLSSKNYSYDGELPLASIQGIIEQNGEIYIGLGEYNRIQVYDSNGKFLEFIKTNNYRKDYNFTINEEGVPQINVIYLRKETIKKYIQKNGSEYFVGSRFPLLIKKKDNTGEHQIIQQPFYMSLCGGQINCWVISAIGIFFFYMINSNIIMDLAGKNISKEEHMKLFFKRIFA